MSEGKRECVENFGGKYSCKMCHWKTEKRDFRMILRWILARWFVSIGRGCNWIGIMPNCGLCD
jgi:hypothetical protein